MAARSPLKPRKRPRQERSRETVDVILEAAARVLARHGYTRATTNRIAEAAGVSVGSLYEYFPNKDAVLVAIAERQLEEMKQAVLASLAGPGPLHAVLRRFVEATLAAHEPNRDLHRVVFSEAPHPPEFHACVLQMEETLAHTLRETLRRETNDGLMDPDTAAHLVVQTVEALSHRYVDHGIHDLDRERFVDEMLALLGGYLSARTTDL